MLHKKIDKFGNEKILTTEEWNSEAVQNSIQLQSTEQEKIYGSSNMKIVGFLMVFFGLTIGGGFGLYHWYTSDMFVIFRIFVSGLIAIVSGGAAAILFQLFRHLY